MTPEHNQPMAFTVDEAARLLRIGRTTAYEAARSGELPTVRIGKRIIVPAHALRALLGEPAAEGAA